MYKDGDFGVASADGVKRRKASGIESGRLDCAGTGLSVPIVRIIVTVLTFCTQLDWFKHRGSPTAGRNVHSTCLSTAIVGEHSVTNQD